MTKDEAITKARQRHERTGRPQVVIERTDHPKYPGQTVYLTAPRAEVRQLSPGSKVIPWNTENAA